MFDVLIIGGGVSGVSCAMVLGSAQNKDFVKDKKIGILTHQKASSLQDAIFYNAYGIPAGKLGADLLLDSLDQLRNTYDHIVQIADEKVLKVVSVQNGLEVITNKSVFRTQIVVVGVGASNLFDIEGLNEYVEPHQKSLPEKKRIQLKNIDYKVTEGVYVCGTLSGHRSQLAIAAGSGAAVATEILVLWNKGRETHSHDSVKKK
ncbi:pyridine nucleotide-disulfide oxidoreductase [Flavobacterium columnare NBRC 100251 = ATCC 23463]|uniref:FAD-dependent pyridine nucleotide-disulfide oxidoreductase n=2 Tax=Flavobacterium columnare TaxID=996 RepID=G8X5L7_FLACA|nr:pyridine nucleotide-disulfide oxidoreductase [Flavobacterium columnare]AEW86861.1 FAD-dependent pyridine nucleotide-disulfide oxidoreductase [Flavobacterium columnare ATCC 49512]AMO20775.1 NAD(P)/FAD-dependent oxidoreductase [Flavobacterium columnare]AUX18760.1 pyridine nucleotide-disulfide oxidoreductase [Flavobacterium columnare]MEB3801787.1 NAD(P)/FAD-dependent oxidoreductase [Flavobacterium columnare]PDS24858.1 pyridine nucleotide-disulfide oxidoreductase [Flavobacterium columnare NBRC 